jgi:hypothetical protein
MVSTSFSCYRAYFLPRRNMKKLKTDSIGSIKSINHAFAVGGSQLKSASQLVGAAQRGELVAPVRHPPRAALTFPKKQPRPGRSRPAGATGLLKGDGGHNPV